MTQPKVAIVRGPNLNRWEMQNFLPLMPRYALTGFTSRGHNFPVDEIPFPVRELPSIGQLLHARVLRKAIDRIRGDYHDLRGLEQELEGFDIVHSAETTYYCTAQAARAKRRMGYKLVVTVWENIPFAVHHPSAVRLKEIVNAEADAFLAVSERTKEVLILEGAPPERITVVMPGVDTEHFCPGPKDTPLLSAAGCSPDDTIVLFVAHLYWEKGIYDVLVAFRQAWDRLRRPPGLRLVIVGNGKEKRLVEEWIRRLQIGEQTRILGNYPYSRMPAVHNLADVFVLPSIPTRRWQEQFGYVLVESMACGKPVIAARSGSIPEVVGDTGVLVEPNDFLGLRDALLGLVTDNRRRQELGTAGRLRAQRLFGLEGAAQRIGEVYARI